MIVLLFYIARNELGILLAYARRSSDHISLYLLYNQPVKVSYTGRYVLAKTVSIIFSRKRHRNCT